jgi:predicted ATPase
MTIVGPAGIGKTTVAVAAADALRASYRHGVRHIDLASLSGPAPIGGLIASRLGVQVVSSDPLHSIVAHLHDKSMLIVLDNCEHLVQAVAHLVEGLLSRAPNLHILATSREPLGAISEWVLRLGPLELPRESAALSAREALQFPAIQLFAERAQAGGDSSSMSVRAARELFGPGRGGSLRSRSGRWSRSIIKGKTAILPLLVGRELYREIQRMFAFGVV